MVKRAKTTEDVVKDSLRGSKKVTSKSGVKRAEAIADIPEPRRKEVEQLQKEVRADKYYFEKVYKRMREDMEYVRLGADKKWVDGDNYTVPIINRFINQAVAALYAKNPRAVAKRKPKLLYQNWDGTQDSAKAALELVSMGNDPTGAAQQVLDDVKNSKQYNQLMERMGRTLEILFEYFTGEDFPDFKKRMKANVRRAKTVGVGYVEVSFHRAMEPDPDVVQRIGDMQNKIALIKSRQADIKDGELAEDDAKAQELEEMLKTLEEEKMRIVSEGLVFDFPRSTDIIPDRQCTQLSGFIGCDRVSREYSLDVEEIKSLFKVDVSQSYKIYVNNSGKNTSAVADTTGNDQEGDRGDNADSDSKTKYDKKDPKGKACVWRIMNKKTRMECWVCDGYPDYLREPKAPDNQVHGFWSIYSLTFNEVEDEKEVFPPSDVHYLKHPQREYNNARQGVREHRKANRPKYFAKRGALEESDKAAIESAPAHAVIEVSGIEGNMTIDQLIQPYKGVPIDPNMYETSSVMKDVMYGVGVQNADLGPTGDSTATESSIAEQSRMSTLSSNVDDLDEFLSEIARGASQILLQQMNKESVTEIVGPGAMWPEMTSEQIAKELFLEVKAGSAGRPNQAAELAALERAMPMLIQIGHISPPVLAKKYCDLLNLDEDEFIVDGMPSIMALNAMAAQHAQAVGQISTNLASSAAEAQHAPPSGGPAAPLPDGSRPAGQPQPPQGNPASNPAAQGPQGQNNMAQGPQRPPGAQPAYPAPVAHLPQ